MLLDVHEFIMGSMLALSPATLQQPNCPLSKVVLCASVLPSVFSRASIQVDLQGLFFPWGVTHTVPSF